MADRTTLVTMVVSARNPVTTVIVAVLVACVKCVWHRGSVGGDGVSGDHKQIVHTQRYSGA